ncbi:MAG: hypothetical protein JNM93_00855 [Bacteriovoracaceae bacterium]|nr:hypothetical protein [Bacteriovoracaceae bacterium]
MLITLLLYFSYLASANSHCDLNMTMPCWVEASRIRPTQFALGMGTVPDNIAKLEKAYAKEKMYDFWIKKNLNAVRSHEGWYYISDGHHTVAGLIYSQQIPLAAKYVMFTSLEQMEYLSTEDFKRYLIQSNKTFLYDNLFNLRTFEELPTDFYQMQDSAYRTFSELVLDNEGYCKVPVLYLEFIWAHYFMNQLNRRGIYFRNSFDNLESYLDLGLQLARDQAASQLPGYGC